MSLNLQPHSGRSAHRALALCAVLCAGGALAQGAFVAGPQAVPGAQAASAPVQPAERGVNEWLLRMHEASRVRSYVGTFVVSSNAGAMSAARIWHACDAERQIERMETLTGAPRSSFRRSGELVTFLPEARTVRIEKLESGMGPFPDLLQARDASIAEFYAARRVGADRVAGFDADVVQLAPKDSFRFGYRIWSEKKSGLVVKLQTLDTDGKVLEQAAFSELQIDAPLRTEKLVQMMATPEGWRVEKSDAARTSASAEGWALKTSVPGFSPINCVKRQAGGAQPAQGTMQWIFSDGLASVSLFVEAYDRQKHVREGLLAAGATHTVTRRIQDWWLTAVGEVPASTLRSFAQGLERLK